ncbi:hypothetical protein E6Q11_01490 [Candidatus Dojkabacteria bacterium]|uniref:Uncharacterized protein n=1 Tax=Candidatus Dojkabacteria bacterium TaxID=2099670 RepID=A0A5C7J9U0_9BACT|nr:MAG: hypothetical protein E6Q11_01490 [Candidatus Dojkabacteria bacterium]
MNNKKVNQDLNAIKRAILIAYWNCCGIYVPKNLQFYEKSVLEVLESCNRNYQKYVEFYVNGEVLLLAVGDPKLGVDQIIGNKFVITEGQRKMELFNLMNLGKSNRKINMGHEHEVSMDAGELGVFVERVYYKIAQC